MSRPSTKEAVHGKAKPSMKRVHYVACATAFMVVCSMATCMFSLSGQTPGHRQAKALNADNVDTSGANAAQEPKTNNENSIRGAGVATSDNADAIRKKEDEEKRRMMEQAVNARKEKIRAKHHILSAWGDIQPVTVGKDTHWERTYARSQTCEVDSELDLDLSKPTAPIAQTNMTDNMAAGPIIDCQGEPIETCNSYEKMWNLDSYQSFAEGTGFNFQLPPFEYKKAIHSKAIALDRARFSTATSVCFLDDKHLVASSFASKSLYLYRFDIEKMETVLLQTLWMETNVDLMQCDLERKRIVTSLLFAKATKIVHYDLDRPDEEKLKIYKFVRLFPEERFKEEYVHDVSFVPNTDHAIVSGTMRWRFGDETKQIRVLDYETERPLAKFEVGENPYTSGFLMKGVRVIDDRHILYVAIARSLGVAGVGGWCRDFNVPTPEEAETRLFLLRMDFDVNDIVNNRYPMATTQNFTLVDHLSVPFSVAEGMDYSEGIAFAADQINDKNIFFKVDLASPKPLSVLGSFSGCPIPHGSSLNRKLDLMGMTCFGDNSVWVHKFSSFWKQQTLSQE